MAVLECSISGFLIPGTRVAVARAAMIGHICRAAQFKVDQCMVGRCREFGGSGDILGMEDGWNWSGCGWMWMVA